jgi:TPR repeat protein
MLRDGRGVPRDLEKAKKALDTAHYGGVADASFELARMLADEGRPADRQRVIHMLGGAARAGHEGARARLRAEADRGSVDAQLALGRTYLATGDRKGGLQRLRQAMAGGSQDALLDLAAGLSVGEASADERAEALMLYGAVQRADLVALAAVLRGDVARGPSPAPAALTPPSGAWGLPAHEAAWFARWGFAPTLSRGDIATQMQMSRIAQRLPEAVLAARAGDAVAIHLAMHELHRRCTAARADLRSCAANMYWMEARPSYRVPVSRKTATDQFTTFQLEELEGMKNADAIGKALDAGAGGLPDYVAAEYYYRLAVNEFLRWQHRFDERAAWAHYRLAHIYENGLTGAADKARAAKHLEHAAEFGHAAAAYAIAHRYLAQGGSDAESSAAHYFRIAGDRGVADGSFRYAQALETGKIAEAKGPQRLYEHYRKAALAGHVPAISGVARAYWNGWGVAKDEAQAEEWWARAARAGDPEAAWLVAVRYSNRQDFQGGLPYLRQAAAGGYPGAAELVPKWAAAGERRATESNGFLAAARFLADVANAYTQQREQERAIQQAQWAAYSNVGQWSSSGTTGSSSGGSSSSSGGTSSSSGGQGGSSGTQGSAGADGGASQSSVGSGRAGSTTSGSSGGGEAGGNDGADAAGSAEGRTSPGQGRNMPGLTIEKAPDRRAELAAAQRAAQKAEADRLARAAEFQAKAAADAAAAKAAEEARRNARIIACYGSLEAFKRATASCQ